VLIAPTPVTAHNRLVPPPVHYVRNGDVSIAHQVSGDGPHDVLVIPGWVSHLALDWEEPTWVRWHDRMGRFARLIRFDKRGTGLSDRPPGIPTLEERMEDARAVLDSQVLNRYGQLTEADIKTLDWMSKPTKARALEKLASVACKVGYPDEWLDYAKLKVVRGDALGNVERASAFALRRELAKIGKSVDRGEWSMTAATDNAYYDEQMNDINFPAGVLQRPNFDMTADDAANYGNLAALIGHELTHGFDDEGRHYDAHGNLKDWWTKEDAKAFEARASGLVSEYSAFVAVKDASHPAKDVRVDGKLTLGENTADNGGIRLSFDAFLTTQGAKAGKDAPSASSLVTRKGGA